MFSGAMHGALIVLKPILYVVAFVVVARFIALIVKMKRG